MSRPVLPLIQPHTIRRFVDNLAVPYKDLLFHERDVELAPDPQFVLRFHGQQLFHGVRVHIIIYCDVVVGTLCRHQNYACLGHEVAGLHEENSAELGMITVSPRRPAASTWRARSEPKAVSYCR
jgi:hypothetical protein